MAYGLEFVGSIIWVSRPDYVGRGGGQYSLVVDMIIRHVFSCLVRFPLRLKVFSQILHA